jgi:Protein of unknown function (DUF3501)
MRPLTLDDLLPLDEYAGRRGEFFDSLCHYQDRYRRVRIGPRVTLLFVNRQMIWFHVQELLRIARLAEPQRVQQELDLYNRLLPGRGHLQAALLIELADETRIAEDLSTWGALAGDSLRLRLGEEQFPARLITARPEDRSIGADHWVQFALDDDAKLALGDLGIPAWFEIAHGEYRHQSSSVSDDVRESLIEDLGG